MNWTPIIILGIMSTLSLGISLGKHGRLEKGKHSFWVTFIAYVVTWALLVWAYYG